MTSSSRLDWTSSGFTSPAHLMHVEGWMPHSAARFHCCNRTGTSCVAAKRTLRTIEHKVCMTKRETSLICRKSTTSSSLMLGSLVNGSVHRPRPVVFYQCRRTSGLQTLLNCCPRSPIGWFTLETASDTVACTSLVVRTARLPVRVDHLTTCTDSEPAAARAVLATACM
jgi:hypothetical protein